MELRFFIAEWWNSCFWHSDKFIDVSQSLKKDYGGYSTEGLADLSIFLVSGVNIGKKVSFGACCVRTRPFIFPL